MQEPDHDILGVWMQRLKWLASFRDAILALGGLLYILGYASWAIYAWQRGLGLLPPLEGQYFVSGLVPALLVAMLAVAFRLLLWIRQKLFRPLDERRKRLSTRLLYTSAVLVVVAWVLAWNWPETRVFGRHTLGWVLFSAFLVGFAGAIYGFDISSRIDRITGGLTYWYAVGALPYLVLICFWIYVDRFFPQLPAELGGPLPKCVTLDITSDRLAQDTLQGLGVTPGDSERASRTGALYLLFRGGGFVIVSPELAHGAALLRVSEEVIAAVGSSAACKGSS